MKPSRAALISMVPLLLTFVACTAAPTATPTATPTQTATATAIPFDRVAGTNIGEYARLWSNDEKFIDVAEDELALREYSMAVQQGDTGTLADLILCGRIFKVARDSRVVVIDSSPNGRQIIIFEGPAAGRANPSGWVSPKLLVPDIK